MATKTVVKFYSDLSGTEIEDGVATVTFALDSTTYEIDLTQAEQKKLRDALTPYVEAGRPKVVRRRSADGPSPSEVRAWAVATGLDVPARGRIPAAIKDAYDATH